VLEGVHFAVEDHAPSVDPSVTAATDHTPLVYQHGAYRNPARAETQLGLFDRQREKRLDWHAFILPQPYRSIRHRIGWISRWEETSMLQMALVFLVIGLLSALLGFTTIAGASFAIAKFLAGLFLILFLVFLIIGMSAVRKIRD
jgi:uncharacterized membrane protein YtjA (UPF0391 family)